MKLIAKLLLPILLLAGAFFGAKSLIESRPPTPDQTPLVVIPKVKTLTLTLTDHRPPIRSFGTISTHDEARIMPELTARVIWIDDNFRIGKKVKKDQLLISLEPRDSEAALEEERANLSDLKRQLAEENVRVARAKSDWISSGRELKTASDFRLRRPQLAALKARLKSVEAAITTAALNLQRAEIRAPFAGQVLTRNVTLGELAIPQTTMGTLASVTLAEVRLPLTPDQIARVDGDLSQDSLAQKPITVRLLEPGRDSFREARITRVDPTTDARNQVRYLIAELPHPFEKTPFSLPLGTFVKAEFNGLALTETLRFSETSLVEDHFIWTLNEENELSRLEVVRLATEEGEVIVRPISEITGPITLVSRPLTTFRPGMKVESLTSKD